MNRILRIAIFTALMTGVAALAQTTGVQFGVTTSAVGINLNKQWIPAADAVESLSIVNSPNYGMFYVEGTQTMSTDQAFNGYFGGLKWIPNIDGLIARTTLPPKTFQFSVHAAPGFTRSTAGVNRFGGRAGVSLDYDPSSAGHFAVNVFRFDYLNAPGFGSSPSGYILSSGIAVFFGGSK